MVGEATAGWKIFNVYAQPLVVVAKFLIFTPILGRLSATSWRISFIWVDILVVGGVLKMIIASRSFNICWMSFEDVNQLQLVRSQSFWFLGWFQQHTSSPLINWLKQTKKGLCSDQESTLPKTNWAASSWPWFFAVFFLGMKSYPHTPTSFTDGHQKLCHTPPKKKKFDCLTFYPPGNMSKTSLRRWWNRLGSHAWFQWVSSVYGTWIYLKALPFRKVIPCCLDWKKDEFCQGGVLHRWVKAVSKTFVGEAGSKFFFWIKQAVLMTFWMKQFRTCLLMRFEWLFGGVVCIRFVCV